MKKNKFGFLLIISVVISCLYFFSCAKVVGETVYNIKDVGPAGGLIFYDKGNLLNGWRYLEAAPYDQSTGIQWYNGSYVSIGGTGTAVETGIANTTAIVNLQGAGSYAAKLCDSLVIGGYSNWFLPSKDELNQIYKYLKDQGTGSFTDGYYWSSSESGSDNAWNQNFSDGAQGVSGKENILRVRAIRAF